jgi:hypothetical protein
MRTVFVPLCLFLLLIISPANSDIHALEYNPLDPVKIWLNKAGPYENPQETYAYFSLPFCKVRRLLAAHAAVDNFVFWFFFGCG